MADKKSGDEFDNLKLDESFVRQASVRELDARKRRRRGALKRFRQRSRAWLHQRRLPLIAFGLVIVIVTATVVRADEMTWRGILLGEKKTSTENASIDQPTTSTTLALAGRAYKGGDCVTWDQSTDKVWTSGVRSTRVLNCDEPHLFEYVAAVDLDEWKQYPSDEQWDEIAVTKCRPLAEKHLDSKIDPQGRFNVSAYRVFARDWTFGNRNAQCVLQLAQYKLSEQVESAPMVPFTGKVKGQPQTWLFEVGDCYEYDRPDKRVGTVPCDEHHKLEIVGTVDLRGKTSRYPKSFEDWNALVGAECSRLGREYAGGPLPPSASASWLDLKKESWDLGRRVVECGVGVYKGDEPSTITGSLRNGGKPTVVAPTALDPSGAQTA